MQFQHKFKQANIVLVAWRCIFGFTNCLTFWNYLHQHMFSLDRKHCEVGLCKKVLSASLFNST